MSQFLYYLEMLRHMRSWNAVPKVWNYLKYRFSKRQAAMSIHQYTPQIASLHLTMRCNLNCGYCNAAKSLKEKGSSWKDYEASLEKVQKIFSNPLFSNCLLVDLLGGEPLLIKDIDKIIAYLTHRGHLTNLSTNGLLLTERITDLKQAGISRINISLYDTNWSMMKHDLLKINKIFPVHTSLVLLRSLIAEQKDMLIEMIRIVHDAGCRSLRFWIYRPMGLNPQPQEIITDNDPIYVKFRHQVENMFPGFCIWPSTVKIGKSEKLCPQLWQRIGCDMAGNMIICCGADEPLPSPNNNLFNSSPEAIINHPHLVRMRQQIIDPESEPPDVCKTCNLLGEAGW